MEMKKKTIHPEVDQPSRPVFSTPESSSQKKTTLFEGKTYMAEKPMNSIGIKLNIDGVRSIKKALTTWKKQMEVFFTMNPKWDITSCHSYAELSMEGIVQSYIKFLMKGTTPEHRNLLTKYEEEYANKRNVDGYVYLISREFIRQTKAELSMKNKNKLNSSLPNLRYVT